MYVLVASIPSSFLDIVPLFMWNNTHSTEFKDWRIGIPIRYMSPLDCQPGTILTLS